MVTVGKRIFPAKFLDKKCYAVMADRKKVFTMQVVGIPVSAVGQGGKAGPQPSSSSDHTSLANSSKNLRNQRCAACSRFTKSVNRRKERVESVDEANAFSLCFGKIIVLNDVSCSRRKMGSKVFDFTAIISDFISKRDHLFRSRMRIQ